MFSFTISKHLFIPGRCGIIYGMLLNMHFTVKGLAELYEFASHWDLSDFSSLTDPNGSQIHYKAPESYQNAKFRDWSRGSLGL